MYSFMGHCGDFEFNTIVNRPQETEDRFRGVAEPSFSTSWWVYLSSLLSCYTRYVTMNLTDIASNLLTPAARTCGGGIHQRKVRIDRLPCTVLHDSLISCDD